jgi:polar amino acid transport system substrate-binding protein
MNAAALRRALLAAAALLLAACAGTAGVVAPEARSALAPGGALRMGLYPGTPTSILGDPAAGTAKGVGFDLGRGLAERAGGRYEPVVYARNAEVLAAVRSGAVDAVFTNATPERAKEIDFSSPIIEVEQGYLVPGGSAIARVEDVDRAGTRVGVSEGSTSESTLSRAFTQATVVRTTSIKSAIGMLASGEIQAFATNKATLYEMSDELPGSRVLDGRWGVERFAVGIPKGRAAAMSLVETFVRESKARGAVGRAIARAGLRGAVPAD